MLYCTYLLHSNFPLSTFQCKSYLSPEKSWQTTPLIITTITSPSPPPSSSHPRPHHTTPTMPPTNLLRALPAPYTSGRGLFLTHKVQPGTLILHVPAPLVAVPDDAHLSSCCSWCLRCAPEKEEEEEEEEKYPDPGVEDSVEEVDLARCSGCRVVWYCGKVCCII